MRCPSTGRKKKGEKSFFLAGVSLISAMYLSCHSSCSSKRARERENERARESAQRGSGRGGGGREIERAREITKPLSLSAIERTEVKHVIGTNESYHVCSITYAVSVYDICVISVSASESFNYLHP